MNTFSEEELISVVVPVYGIDRYLGLCIESLINQTYGNLEIILVDDGSKDRCPEICDLYAGKDKRIKVIHKANGGLVSARKAGLLASRGRYIGYVDGDDWVGPGFFSSLYYSMTASNADIVCAGFSRDLFSESAHFQNNIVSGEYEGERLEQLRKNMLSYGAFFKTGISTYVWNKLFKREILMDVQMNVDENISIGEDAAVVYPALMRCSRVCIVDNCAYHYRQREDSMLKRVSPFSNEAKKLKSLYDYLSGFAKTCDAKYGIQRQVDEFVSGICIMRSGDLSFFHKQLDGKSIVVYSAGTFGQQLVNRVKEKKSNTIAGWIDDDYWEYRRCCMDVDPVSDIVKLDYDYVLIATIDTILADAVKIKLLEYGVQPEKILKVELHDNDLSGLLAGYIN